MTLTPKQCGLLWMLAERIIMQAVEANNGRAITPPTKTEIEVAFELEPLLKELEQAEQKSE